MICIIRKKNKFYKRTLLDVWGHLKLYKKYVRLIHFMKIIKQHRKARRLLYKREFVYSFRKRIWFRFKKRLKKKYIKHRYLFNFYLILKKHNFLKYKLDAKRKMGSYKQNYLTFVEGRLFMLIYRANFVNNIFKVKHVIDDGFFLVNGKRQYYSNYNVKPGELIQIGFKYRDLFKYDMIYRLKFKFMKRNSRDYLFVNLKFLFIFFIRSPFLKEIRFPIRIDILKGADFYFL